jgi:DNA-binding transcriptional ArsR family regulator
VVYSRAVAASVLQVDDDARVQALAHPARIALLDVMRLPESAAGAARHLGQPRQTVNYHVKELLKAGLIRPAGERRKGNFVEQLYESVANAFVVSPRFTWSDRRVAALRDQVSLEHLAALGERVQRDVTALLDHAAFDGVDVPSAAVTAEVHLADEQARTLFMEEYLRALGPILKKYGRRKGTPFRLAVAIYPAVEESN